eukprot:UN05023
MEQSWFKHGDKLKLQLVRDLLNDLPLSSSVSITSPEKLSRELFTHKGDGTLICHREPVEEFNSFDDIDLKRLKCLLEDAFDGKLQSDYFDRVKHKVKSIFLSRTYNGVAIILKDESGFDLMDKFAVRSLSSNSGMGARLFANVRNNHPNLIWRAKSKNPINPWYFSNATGTVKIPNSIWTMFWTGDASLDQLKQFEDMMGHRAGDFYKSDKPSKQGDLNIDRLAMPTDSTTTNNIQPLLHTGQGQNKIKIGLLGARGYTGNELAHLLDTHGAFDLTVVGSRQYEGKRACDVLNTSSQANITNITPEHMVEKI